MTERGKNGKRKRRDRKAELVRHIVMFFAVLAAVIVIVGIIAARKKRVRTDVQEDLQGAPVESISAGTDVSGGTEEEQDNESGAGMISESSSVSSIPEETENPYSAGSKDVVMTDLSGDWRLVLVNPTHKLPDDFEVQTDYIWDGEPERVDYRITGDLRAMLEACENAGHSPLVRSSFRTHAQQQDLYDSKTEEFMAEGESREEARIDAAAIVAIPGTSEHQLGLALDIVSMEYGTLNASQADNPTQQWLMEHCWEYGFILRYPTDKGDVTGIIYEPWHYRYVGKEYAEIMRREELCLEEYLFKYGNRGNEQ